MKLLEQYFELQQQIFDYFGYVEDWRVLPIDNSTDYFWRLDENEVFFADSEDELENECGNFYANEIYRQRHLPKWVYEGEEYTMIVVDTNTDGNQFLQVFSNAMRRD